MSATGSQIVAEARSRLSTPFHHQGRCDIGVDCSGLVVLTLRALGFSIMDVEGYSEQPDGNLESYVAMNADLVVAVPPGTVADDIPAMLPAVRPGDVLVFAVSRRNRTPQHLGFFTGHSPLTMIHSYSEGTTMQGSVIENTLDTRWLRRLLSVYRAHGTIVE